MKDMNEDIYITIYTKERGKLSLTLLEFNSLDTFLTFHREDGPATESIDGHKVWCIDGNFHREDGPAIENKMYKAWYIKGKVHREDGPAKIYINPKSLNMSKYWFIEDDVYPEKEFNRLIKEVDSLNPVLGLTDEREWVRERFKRKLKEVV